MLHEKSQLRSKLYYYKIDNLTHREKQPQKKKEPKEDSESK